MFWKFRRFASHITDGKRAGPEPGLRFRLVCADRAFRFSRTWPGMRVVAQTSWDVAIKIMRRWFSDEIQKARRRRRRFASLFRVKWKKKKNKIRSNSSKKTTLFYHSTSCREKKLFGAFSPLNELLILRYCYERSEMIRFFKGMLNPFFPWLKLYWLVRLNLFFNVFERYKVRNFGETLVISDIFKWVYAYVSRKYVSYLIFSAFCFAKRDLRPCVFTIDTWKTLWLLLVYVSQKACISLIEIDEKI